MLAQERNEATHLSQELSSSSRYLHCAREERLRSRHVQGAQAQDHRRQGGSLPEDGQQFRSCLHRSGNHRPYLQPPEQAAEMVRRAGVRAFKTTIDRVTGTGSKIRKLDPESPVGWELTSRQLDEVVEFMQALRKAVGPDIEIALECHTKYSTESAIQLAKAVEPFRPMWLEEPIPSDNPDAMALVRLPAG
jgi:L-alanine-DL-glutamate epimerase-like enolase superfamily enzyme